MREKAKSKQTFAQKSNTNSLCHPQGFCYFSNSVFLNFFPLKSHTHPFSYKQTFAFFVFCLLLHSEYLQCELLGFQPIRHANHVSPCNSWHCILPLFLSYISTISSLHSLALLRLVFAAKIPHIFNTFCWAQAKQRIRRPPAPPTRSLNL